MPKDQTQLFTGRQTEEIGPEELESARVESFPTGAKAVSDIITMLRSLRAGQVAGLDAHKGHYQRLANTLGQQNSELNNLSNEVAGLSAKTTNLELEQSRQRKILGKVKELQDGCAARVTHTDDSTEIRSLRDQFHRAVLSRRSTPPRGTPPPVNRWWQSQAGKAVLGALAGLLVAITTGVTTYFATRQSGPPEPAVHAPVVRSAPVREPRRGPDETDGDLGGFAGD